MAPNPTFAPVLNSGEIVERVWAELFKRAGGHIEPEVTDDADIHLVVDGVRREPAEVHDGIYTFFLEGPAAVCDCARAAACHRCSGSVGATIGRSVWR